MSLVGAVAGRLRTRLTPVALAIYLVVAVSYTTAKPTYWLGEWGWTVNWATGLVILLAPSVAGVAALETARWRETERTLLGVDELPRHLVVTWLVVMVSAVAVFVLHGAVLIAVSASRHPTDTLQPSFALLGIGQLGIAVGVGMLLGRLLRPWVAVPLAVPVMYLLEIVPKPAFVPDVLVPGASTGSIAGLVVDPPALVAQFAFQVMLAVTVVALCAVVGRRGRGRAVIAPVAALSGAVVAALACQVSGAVSDPYVARPAWTCAGSAPRVCLLRGNTAYLGEWASAMHGAAGASGVANLGVPDEFRQLPGRDEQTLTGFGIIVGNGGLLNVGPPSSVDVADSLSSPSNCHDHYLADSANRGAIVRYWMSTWITHRISPDPELRRQDPALARWVAATPLADQDRFARSVYARMKDCTADDAFASTLPTSAR